MIKRLERAPRDVQPPTCEACNVTTEWYRSQLVEADPLTIRHYFACPKCHASVETIGPRTTGTDSDTSVAC